MAYLKVIRSGTMVETYLYERPPSPKRMIQKPRRKRIIPQERRKDHIDRARNAFRRLVRANLSTTAPPALVTLTIHDAEIDIGEAYKAYTQFAKYFRRKYGQKVSLIAVPEFQKRGAVHFHILVFNWPYEAYKNERSTREVAGLWKLGFVDVKRTDGNEKLSSYLAKYMSKAMSDYRLIRKRAYSASRNVVRPVSLNTPLQTSFVTKEWGLGVDNFPVQERDYGTMWLGRCVYKQYTLKEYEGSTNV